MPKLRKSIIGMAVACVLLMLQFVGAGSAAATPSSDVQAYKPCSDIGIGVYVSVANDGHTWFSTEIAYHGNDCNDQARANYIYTSIFACDAGGNCSIGVANPNYSADVGSYDFFDSRVDSTGVSGYYYKFCVNLRNDDLERYNNVCTGLVHP